MAEHHPLGRFHIIVAIRHRARRTHRIRRKLEYFSAQPTSIRVVGDNKADAGQKSDKEGMHGAIWVGERKAWASRTENV